MSDGRALRAPREVHEHLAVLDSLRMKTDPEYRLMMCQDSPVRFAVHYFFDYLSDPVTGQASIARFHVDMAREAQRWVRKGEPGRRNIWIAPRESGKTVWQFLILPIWALGFGHKRFFLAFADTEQQAKGHLANIRDVITRNEDLRGDFPGLIPERRSGSSNTTTEVVTSSGAMFAARGIDSGALGIRRGNTRPDLLTGDDLEPTEANYSIEAKRKRLSTLLTGVLPMNQRATLNIQGTTMMHGSIIHEAVQHARGEQVCEWVRDHGFRVRYYPAIVERPDGSRASMWPAKWPLAELERDEHTALFQLEKMNLPVLDKADAWWSDDLFVHRETPVVDRIMHVDIAVTSKARSDYTAIAIMGLDVSRRKVVVEYARQFRIGPAETKRKIHELARDNGIKVVYVEVNQGQDYVRDQLEPMPPGTRLEAYSASASKQSRIKNLLYHYEYQAIEHARRLKALEDQQRAYPSRAAHDDLVDTVAGGVWRLLGDARGVR